MISTAMIMNSNAVDNADVAADVESDRYAWMSVGEEEFVVFDRENHRAWIQSSGAVAVKEHR